MTNQLSGDAIIKTRSATLVKTFSEYLHWYLSRNFHAVRISRAGLPQDFDQRPLIIYSNHPSWWDPLLFFVLGYRFFAWRIVFGPMDADALEKYRFMKRLGVFGVELNSVAGSRRFLRTADELLARPDTSLWITAQGEFSDPRRRPLGLRPGIAHLARKRANCVLLPLAIEYPLWTERYPEALIAFDDPVFPEQLTGSSAACLTILEEQLRATMDRLQTEAMTRNEKLFTTLIDGNTGVGGIYDAYKRVKGLLTGKPHDPTHGMREQ